MIVQEFVALCYLKLPQLQTLFLSGPSFQSLFDVRYWELPESSTLQDVESFIQDLILLLCDDGGILQEHTHTLNIPDKIPLTPKEWERIIETSEVRFTYPIGYRSHCVLR